MSDRVIKTGERVGLKEKDRELNQLDYSSLVYSRDSPEDA